MTIVSDTLAKTKEKDGIHTRVFAEDKLFVYWHTSPLKTNMLNRFFKQSVSGQIMRVYDVTKQEVTNNESYPYLEIRVPDQQNYWRLKGLKEHKVYILELGLLIEGHYFPVHRSEFIHLKKADFIQEQKSPHMVATNSRGWTGNVSTYSFYEDVEGSELDREQ
ncbi:DUF4912 domain-containing protein [Robertmurraya korlensis]|uniref:DUF4912 domain-containing protein n=1 Tax=Robertmurraya korlensis TaxID=519977 RepID=UPI0008260F78|nr:DUF4912 domain-containing protein [Robertmurraya korlensis]